MVKQVISEGIKGINSGLYKNHKIRNILQSQAAEVSNTAMRGTTDHSSNFFQKHRCQANTPSIQPFVNCFLS